MLLLKLGKLRQRETPLAGAGERKFLERTPDGFRLLIRGHTSNYAFLLGPEEVREILREMDRVEEGFPRELRAGNPWYGMKED